MSRLVERFRTGVERARDPLRAVRMAAYVRGQFPFAGVPRPGLVAIHREAVAGLAPPAGEAVAAFLAEHDAGLSGLSRREAERGVEMGRAAALSARAAGRASR